MDDCNGEILGYTMERLLAAGALDVHYTAIYMKKNRPAWELTVLCHAQNREELEKIIFEETTTIGIRENILRRYTLTRRTETEETVYGPVRCKISAGYGTQHKKYEYDDLARIAKENNLSIETVLTNIKAK